MGTAFHPVELEDRAADLTDDLVQLVDRGGEAVPRTTRPEMCGQALQCEAGAEQSLDDVVVQVGGDAVALLQHCRALLLGTSLCEFDGHRRLIGEASSHLLVAGGERRPPSQPCSGQYATHAVRAGQRHEQDRPDVEVDGHHRRVLHVGPVGSQRPAAGEHVPGQRPFARNPQAGHALGTKSHGHFDPQVAGRLVVLGRKEDGHEVRIGGRAAELADELQRRAGADVGGQQPPRDGDRGLEPSSLRTGRCVEPGIVDRHGGGGRERLDELLVLGAELVVAALGEIEVAEDLVPDPDGDAEEAVHRRVPLREARGPRVVGDAPEQDRFGRLDQRSEKALALRKMADPGDVFVRHPAVHELGEVSRRGDHAERGVSGTDQLPSRVDDAAEHRRQGEVRADQLVRP